jgi:hypothetical protein
MLLLNLFIFNFKLRIMKRFLLKLLLFFCFFIIPLILLFRMPYTEAFSFNFISGDCYNHGAWIYDRIVRNSTPVDIAFIGSSHTIHAFQEKKLEEMLCSPSHAVNLGYCRSGRNFEYALLKILLAHKTPKVIVIEVTETESRYSHDIFPYIASAKDLLLPATIYNRDFFPDVFNGTLARLEFFKSRYLFHSKIPDGTNELFGYGADSRTVSDVELRDNIAAWKKRFSRYEPAFIKKIAFTFPFSYLGKSLRMLKDRNIRVIFVYLPEYGSKLPAPEFSGYYEQNSKLLLPPKGIIEDASNWMDGKHLNDKGSELLTEWFAGELNNDLSKTE